MITPAYINNLASIHPKGEAEGRIETSGRLDACEPDYKEAIKNPALRRRMSRVVKMGVACGLECIGQTPKEEIRAIVTATGLGCLADTEKFMNNLLDNNEQLLNPTPFIQSTFNTVGAQIALLCGNRAYNVTYSHRGFSFESALLDGLLRLDEGDRNVLIGAFDEITETSLAIQQRMGLLKGARAGEGAQFFLLSKEKREDSLAQVAAPHLFFNPGQAGGSATDKEFPETVALHIRNYLKNHRLTPEEIGLFVSGETGNPDRDVLYSFIKSELFPHAARDKFKEKCGEYQTAGAYALWQTVHRLQDSKNPVRHALIYNHYNCINHSLILVSKP